MKIVSSQNMYPLQNSASLPAIIRKLAYNKCWCNSFLCLYLFSPNQPYLSWEWGVNSIPSNLVRHFNATYEADIIQVSKKGQ